MKNIEHKLLRREHHRNQWARRAISKRKASYAVIKQLHEQLAWSDMETFGSYAGGGKTMLLLNRLFLLAKYRRRLRSRHVQRLIALKEESQ